MRMNWWQLPFTPATRNNNCQQLPFSLQQEAAFQSLTSCPFHDFFSLFADGAEATSRYDTAAAIMACSAS
jgi:hypothetical protein